MRLEILGGPFDGGVLDVPRRTPPGLRIRLASADSSAWYLIVLDSGVLTAVCAARSMSARPDLVEV